MTNRTRRASITGSEQPDDRPPHTCQVCFRSYERLDHLNRHLDSHRNERTFRCHQCRKGFNRRDLLLRHQAAHEKNALDGRTGPKRAADRAIVACDNCVVTKSKCDDGRPCRRCEKRNIECITKANPATSQLSPSDMQFSHGMPTPSDHPVLEEPTAAIPRPTVDQAASKVPDIVDPDLYQDSNLCTAIDFETGPSFPSFFEHIMAPGTEYHGGLAQLPPNLSTFIPDQEWFESSDIFGSGFPTMEEIFVMGEEDQGAPQTSEPDAPIDAEFNSGGTAHKRHAIFQRSPWLWKPNENQNAFSDHHQISIDEHDVDMNASPHQPYAPQVAMQDTISLQTRDRIFHLVLKIATTRISIPSFPSPKCLDAFIKVGIAKKLETDAWIHPYTFNSETARPEFLAALVAAGCVCFGIPSISRTGIILLDIVRAALSKLADNDNSALRDLQYLQASMVWLDIGAFCGLKRLMEIAESNLQPLVTALRRMGKFDAVAYTVIAPSLDDQGIALEKKWQDWVRQESYRRLVYHLFGHDMQLTMVKHRAPIVSYAEISAPLPASQDLWLAPSAAAWKLSYFHKYGDQKPPSLKDLLVDCEILRCFPDNACHRMATAAYINGLAAQTWEYFQQSSISGGNTSSGNASTYLWLQSRQHYLAHALQTATEGLPDVPAILTLLNQFLLMYINVNLDQVSRFAGKCGEDEAHRAYTVLLSWSLTRSARTAIWHAGQVVRVARTIPPYQLRGSDAFIIYHSIMVLWAYGLLQRDLPRRSGTATPNANPLASNPRFRPSQHARCPIVIDGMRNSLVDSFIITSTGRPFVTLYGDQGQLCDLQNARMVMTVGAKVLEGNYPSRSEDDTSKDLPPLIGALRDLMIELGNLG